jgi:DEAD/DEAH box helicase domain-containing protein
VAPAYAEILEYCDERCQDFVQLWAESGLPLPVVGYELMDERGRVCSGAELAWPDRKVAALLPEEFDRKAAFESRGWTVFDASELKKRQDEIRSLILLP